MLILIILVKIRRFLTFTFYCKNMQSGNYFGEESVRQIKEKIKSNLQKGLDDLYAEMGHEIENVRIPKLIVDGTKSEMNVPYQASADWIKRYSPLNMAGLKNYNFSSVSSRAVNIFGVSLVEVIWNAYMASHHNELDDRKTARLWNEVWSLLHGEESAGLDFFTPDTFEICLRDSSQLPKKIFVMQSSDKYFAMARGLKRERRA